MHADFELAVFLKDKVIHHAVSWFTGDAEDEEDMMGAGGFPVRALCCTWPFLFCSATSHEYGISLAVHPTIRSPDSVLAA